MTYNKETWHPTDYFTEETANKWEQGLADACENINEIIAGGGGGGSSNYSLNEQVVGKWVDGRDVYQKTWVNYTSVSTGSSFVFPHGIERFDCVIQCNMFTRRTGFGKWEPVTNCSGYEYYARYVVDDTNVEYRNESSDHHDRLIVTMRYLKKAAGYTISPVTAITGYPVGSFDLDFYGNKPKRGSIREMLIPVKTDQTISVEFVGDGNYTGYHVGLTMCTCTIDHNLENHVDPVTGYGYYKFIGSNSSNDLAIATVQTTGLQSYKYPATQDLSLTATGNCYAYVDIRYRVNGVDQELTSERLDEISNHMKITIFNN